MVAYAWGEPMGRPLDVADIAAEPGGVKALHRRVQELRSCGLDFAANTIEREMAALGLPTVRAGSVPAVDSIDRTAG
ncbi:hypothetical protein [Nocardia brasiliensis]|uniref:hypothetical protein n=1 Tax=Nocardia brasiliensis TaxID=37326 RepID=UPI00245752A7|nr:hypothetical protein [Nocardia brasiliensis]